MSVALVGGPYSNLASDEIADYGVELRKEAALLGTSDETVCGKILFVFVVSTCSAVFYSHVTFFGTCLVL